eukprot:7394205-Alexandrium_andersonii.AAC.1
MKRRLIGVGLCLCCKAQPGLNGGNSWAPVLPAVSCTCPGGCRDLALLPRPRQGAGNCRKHWHPLVAAQVVLAE